MTSSRSPARLVPLVALCLACGETPAAPPLDSLVRGASPTISLAPGRADGFAAALEDARTRLLPALQGSIVKPELEVALDLLARALSSRDPAALERALQLGDAALLRGLAAPDEEAASRAVELDAVRLILLEARLLTGPAP